MKRLAQLATLLFLAALGWAQQPAPPISTSTLSLPVLTQLAPVNTAQISLVGNPGPVTYYYWVVVNYEVGSTAPVFVGSFATAPNTLSSSNYLVISPNYPSTPYTSIDLLRRTDLSTPTGACNCAVATGVTAGSINDQSNTRLSYTVNPVNLGILGVTLTNEVVGSGESHLYLRQNGVFVSDLSTVGAGGTITGVTTAGGSGLSGGGLTGTLALTLLTTCSANQVLQWNGSAWACANNGTGTITGVTTASGSGLSGGGSSGSLALTLLTTCSTNQILQWNGSAWACATAATGISGLTTGYLTKAASSTTISNSLFDDGITTPNTGTYGGSGGLASASFESTNTTAPLVALSPYPGSACSPVSGQNQFTFSTDGNGYLSNDGGACNEIYTGLTLSASSLGNAILFTGGGTANAQTGTHINGPAITAYTDGMAVQWTPVASNTSTAPTFGLDSATPVTVVKQSPSSSGGSGPAFGLLSPNDIYVGSRSWVIYVASVSEWVLQNPSSLGSSSLSGMTANGIPIAATTSSVTSSLNSGTTNGFYQVGFNVTGGTAVPPTATLPGIPIDASNPANLPCATDRGAYLNWTSGATLTLPAITGNCAFNLPFLIKNTSGGSLAITPTTPNNIDGGSSQAASSVLNNWAVWTLSDVAGPNWYTIKVPTLAAFPSSACSAGTFLQMVTLGGFTCANVLGSTGSASIASLTMYGSTGSSNLAPPYIDMCAETGSTCGWLYPSTTFAGSFGISSSAPTTDVAAGKALYSPGGVRLVYTTGSASTIGLLQCFSGTLTVTNCASNAKNFLGVTEVDGNSNTSLKSYGLVTINIPSSTTAAGDYICSGTLSGTSYNAVDNGSTQCPAGQQVGFADATNASAVTSVQTQLTSANGVTGGSGSTTTIASGTSALGTSAISSGACATVVTTTASGVASTDAIEWTPNASIKAVTGYAPSTSGGLSIAAYPTSGNVNFDVCNWSSGSITPGAVTLNWRVVR
jgi:hypothetical protein